MEAFHELVANMMFDAGPHWVEITTKAGVIMEVVHEDWVGNHEGSVVAKWMPDPG